MAWGRAVKARFKTRTGRQGPPPLWLFTDASRLPDPRALVARLPVGLCGVVLRHDTAPDRAALGRDLARLCRARRNLLVVAGDARLASRLQAGLHLRGGRRPVRGGAGKLPPLVTSSAHDRVDMRRAARQGAAVLFLSPLFATASHPGLHPLGPVRWMRLAARPPQGASVFALGGVTGRRARRIPPGATGCGAIGAFGGDHPAGPLE